MFSFKLSILKITIVVSNNETTTILFNYKYTINKYYIIIP